MLHCNWLTVAIAARRSPLSRAAVGHPQLAKVLCHLICRLISHAEAQCRLQPDGTPGSTPLLQMFLDFLYLTVVKRFLGSPADAPPPSHPQGSGGSGEAAVQGTIAVAASQVQHLLWPHMAGLPLSHLSCEGAWSVLIATMQACAVAGGYTGATDADLQYRVPVICEEWSESEAHQELRRYFSQALHESDSSYFLLSMLSNVVMSIVSQALGPRTEVRSRPKGGKSRVPVPIALSQRLAGPTSVGAAYKSSIGLLWFTF